MKKIILLFLGFTISCSAQSPIVDLLDDHGTVIPNAYYKDVNNLLNIYEGTYLYTNGTSFFKIVLIKRIMKSNTSHEGQFFEDLIIGEYQYVENGVEKVNTLPSLNANYSRQWKHNIVGNNIINKNNRPVCIECNTNEKRLQVSITDASTGRYATIVMRRINENGIEVLKIKIYNAVAGTLVEGEPEPADFSLPQGEFTLIKQ